MDHSPALARAIRRNHGTLAAPAIRAELAEKLGCAPADVAFASLDHTDGLLFEIRHVVYDLAFQGVVPDGVDDYWTAVGSSPEQLRAGFAEVRAAVPEDEPLCIYYADTEYTGTPIVDAGVVLRDPFAWLDPLIGVLEAITADGRSGFRLRVAEDEHDRIAPAAEIEWCWWRRRRPPRLRRWDE